MHTNNSTNINQSSLSPNSYGEEDNFEWRQYFLRDDDTLLSKCPFHQMLRFIKQEK